MDDNFFLLILSIRDPQSLLPNENKAIKAYYYSCQIITSIQSSQAS